MLHRAATAADVILDGLLRRGPVQSVPGFIEELAVADAASRRAWTAWADHSLDTSSVTQVAA